MYIVNSQLYIVNIVKLGVEEESKSQIGSQRVRWGVKESDGESKEESIELNEESKSQKRCQKLYN